MGCGPRKLRRRQAKKTIHTDVDPTNTITVRSFVFLLSVVIGPYLLIHFFLSPLPLLALGKYCCMGSPSGDSFLLSFLPRSTAS